MATLARVSAEHATTVARVIEMLKATRLEKGISQQKLAVLTGLSRTGIRHIESGEFRPTLYSLLCVADALEVDLPSLIAGAASAEENKPTRSARRSPRA